MRSIEELIEAAVDQEKVEKEISEIQEIINNHLVGDTSTTMVSAGVKIDLTDVSKLEMRYIHKVMTNAGYRITTSFKDNKWTIEVHNV